MANRVLIVILALLVIIAGGAGYYSYTLHRQIDDLDGSFKTFQLAQEARVAELGSELSSLQADTRAYLDNLKEQVAGLKNDIGALDNKISTAEEHITGLEGEIATVNLHMESLEDSISRTLVDANKVYQEVSRVTVRITDGQFTAGSGFIFDNDGHVVTAYHVVESLTPIYVILDDGRISEASVAGYCPFSDVAVLSLDMDPAITPPVIGDSSLMRVGDPVIVMGSPGESDNPLGLKDTLTAGILSQVNRFVNIEDRFIANLLQFDAAVNFGNSGGPLADSRGEIIGLVTARIDPILGDGIYWAVSSNKFRRVAEAIIETGSFDYPWVGIGITDLTPQMVQDYSLDSANGVLVTAVMSGDPADLAGVRVNDVIVGIDGLPVRDSGELTSYLGERNSPGDEMTLEMIRDGSQIELPVEVGKRE